MIVSKAYARQWYPRQCNHKTLWDGVMKLQSETRVMLIDVGTLPFESNESTNYEVVGLAPHVFESNERSSPGLMHAMIEPFSHTIAHGHERRASELGSAGNRGHEEGDDLPQGLLSCRKPWMRASTIGARGNFLSRAGAASQVPGGIIR